MKRNKKNGKEKERKMPKKEYDHKRRQDVETYNDEEATFVFPILDTREILGEEVKM